MLSEITEEVEKYFLFPTLPSVFPPNHPLKECPTQKGDKLLGDQPTLEKPIYCDLLIQFKLLIFYSASPITDR